MKSGTLVTVGALGSQEFDIGVVIKNLKDGRAQVKWEFANEKYPEYPENLTKINNREAILAEHEETKKRLSL